MGENGDGQVALLEGNGTQLMDTEGQLVYETPGWHLLHDQQGYALCNQDRNLCFEEVNEDELAMMMQSVPRRAPVTVEQVDSMIEQNQQLQMELYQLLLVHRNDAEHTQETMKQNEAQTPSDFRAMQAEFKQKKAEWAEKACIDKEKSDAQQKDSDTK